MIVSELQRGLIYAAGTPLASTLVVVQAGPMMLLVRAGTYTSPAGETFTLAVDKALPILAHPTERKVIEGFLARNPDGEVDVFLAWRVGAGDYLRGRRGRYAPPGWSEPITWLFRVGGAGEELPPAAEALDAVPVYVLRVEPGFAPGTRDPRQQSGTFPLGTPEIALRPPRRDRGGREEEAVNG